MSFATTVLCQSLLTYICHAALSVYKLVQSTAASLTARRSHVCTAQIYNTCLIYILHGTVFHTIFIISVTLVFSSAASKLNYFVEHASLVVSAAGRSVNSAIEMILLLYCTDLTFVSHIYCTTDITRHCYECHTSYLYLSQQSDHLSFLFCLYNTI